MISRERQGEFFILVECTFWSIFPIITVLSFQGISPMISLAWSTLFATLFFAVLLTVRGKWRELTNTSALKDIFYAGILLGFFFYVFYFFGLKYTTPGNASLIGLTEVLFSFLFFNIWKKHHISRAYTLGAALMVLGAAIVLAPNFKTFNPGDIFVMIAVAFAPIGNYFAKRARTQVSSETVMFLRSLIAFPLIFIFAYILGQGVYFGGGRSGWIFLAVNGVVMFGLSKIFWVEGIHRIPVTKAISLASISPLLTLLFSWLILHQVPTAWQLLSFLPLAAGVFILTSNKPVQLA